MLQELAWESEKKRLAVAKLRKYFLDDLEVEHIVLHSFRYCSLALVCFMGVYSTPGTKMSQVVCMAGSKEAMNA